MFYIKPAQLLTKSISTELMLNMAWRSKLNWCVQQCVEQGYKQFDFTCGYIQEHINYGHFQRTTPVIVTLLSN